MEVVMSTRHGEVSDRTRRTAERRFGRLSTYESRVSRIEVTFSREKDRWEVDALARVDRAEPVHAAASGADAATAVIDASGKMERQLRRLPGRHVDHQAPGAGAGPGGGT